MSAARLREAATRMRELAGRATAGPWSAASTADTGYAVHRGEHDTVSLYSLRNDAAYIAAMHPP